MDSFYVGAMSALWLGILTSISPCPLATNIAAISYIGNRVNDTIRTILLGLLYSFGRMIAYTAIGVLLVSSILTIPSVSMFLQSYMNKILGPILILAGMFLLELITINLPGTNMSERVKKLADKGGLLGAVLMGIIFALSFCPVSAALFFGSLIPLAVQHNSGIFMPSLYGIGTALPVLAFALLVATGSRLLGNAFDKIMQFERWARRITGIIFIIVGIYYSITYIFEIQF